MQEIFKYNPRKCNFASSFSGCVYRNKNKCYFALPANAQHVRVFEKTLIGGFSCINTRFAFDTEVLIDKNENEKVILDLLLDGKKQTKRISSNVIKMDENNQHDMAMTKPLPYGCIKKRDQSPTLAEFNKIINEVSHVDSIGHLFIVDIRFNDIYPKTCYLMNSIRQYLKK